MDDLVLVAEPAQSREDWPGAVIEGVVMGKEGVLYNSDEMMLVFTRKMTLVVNDIVASCYTEG